MMTVADLVGTKAFLKWGKYKKYSSQQLVDCTYRKYGVPGYSKYLNSGCNGGLSFVNT